MAAPKVFVSHAWEDKERFVLEFAKKLRARGVDAWVDKWEMQPGDSLVDKIFEEGIKNAQAVIVVLSSTSVNKKWVREELNASLIKRISGSSKLIPVIIDPCEIPECLQSTLWVKIEDLNNYDVELEQIVMSIYGHYDRPPLGEAPLYTQAASDSIADLSKLDSLILKVACGKAIETEQSEMIMSSDVLAQLEPLGVHPNDFYESLEILAHRNFIKLAQVISDTIPYFSITLYGFNEYAKKFINGYDSLIDAVAFQIVNQKNDDNESIAKSLNQPLMIIDHILRLLDNNRLISISEFMGRAIEVNEVSAELKRMLRRSS